MCLTPRRKPKGPCAAPGCPTPEVHSGQWTKVPDNFNGQLRSGNNGYCCKRVRCRDKVGLQPLTDAGKKRAMEAAQSAPPGTSGRTTQQPCPPFINEANQIWGLRCAALSAPSSLDAECLARGVGRYANETVTSDPELAGNMLMHNLSTTTEYLVHGHYLRSQNDANGTFGAWYVDLHMLYRDLGKEKTDELLDLFESRQKGIRDVAYTEVEARLQSEQQTEGTKEAAPEEAAPETE